MQFLAINKKTKLTDIAAAVGSRNVESILHLNDVDRVPDVGEAFWAECGRKIQDAADVSYDKKLSLLNGLTSDSDIFETAALTSASGWKLLASMNTLPGYLRIPESIVVPASTSILGNGQVIASSIYDKVVKSLTLVPHTIDPSIFNDYSTSRSGAVNTPFMTGDGSDPMQWFRIPWGMVSLYSSLSDDKVDFPVYPEEISDGVKANYTTMPDLLYQYEPWQIYESSGPRSQSYTFDFHRDMWTGDHGDGKANQLIRFCEANCYPEYRGSAVYTSLVTLYVAGKPLITGIMNDVSVSWDGPLGKRDNWYLHCKLTLSITEVSQQTLNYNTVKNKGLIG